jgi:hypothetical protein
MKDFVASQGAKSQRKDRISSKSLLTERKQTVIILGLVDRARGGAVWQLVGLITRRSQVQILSPLPTFFKKLQPISVGTWS